MLPKLKRLTTKDVRYINRQRNIFWTKFFSFSTIPQYPNKKYNQLSLHVPKVLTKFATKRHFIKRRLLNFLEQEKFITKQINGKFYKIFINFNKKNIPGLKQDLINYGKYEFTNILLRDFERGWKFYISKLK